MSMAKRVCKQGRSWVIVALVLILAACGQQAPTASGTSSSAPTSSEAASSATPTEGEPVVGGTLVIGIQTDPILNPNLNTQGPTQQIGTMLYEPLVYFDMDEQEPMPLLAKDYTVSDDGLTYTFNLVEAQWSDGEDFTSADVKYTLEEGAKTFTPFAPAFALIQDVDASDPLKAVVTLSQPFGPFLLSLTRVEMLPEHVYAGTDPLTNPASTDAPVGTGPFILERFTRGVEWVLVRNPNYWQDGYPYLDSIVARVVGDTDSASLSLITGEIKYVSSQVIPASQAKTLDQEDHLVLHRDSFAPNATYVMFNTTREITGNPDIRHAIAMAIDREFLHQSVFDGFGAVATSPIDARLAWAHNPAVNFNELYPYDPAGAEALLDSAGYPRGEDGTRFDLTILAEAASRFQAVAEAIASMLQEVGINATVDSPEASVMQEKAFTPPGDFDVFVISYTTNGDPALGTERIYVTDRIGKPFGNASGYSNPEVDRLFQEGRTATTTDDRAVPYFEVQEILARDLPSMPLIETTLYDVVDVTVHGLWHAANWGQWQRAWVAPAG